jgi:hypothetical protein
MQGQGQGRESNANPNANTTDEKPIELPSTVTVALEAVVAREVSAVARDRTVVSGASVTVLANALATRLRRRAMIGASTEGGIRLMLLRCCCVSFALLLYCVCAIYF